MGGAALIGCPHGGRADAASAVSDLLLDGSPVLTGVSVFTVAGCPHTVGGVASPCTAVGFGPASHGVLADGAPVLLDTTPAQCFSAGLVPQGPPAVTAGQRGVVCG
jgi:hypothetical protein